MRPTFLQFKSPKERTPDPYDITITSNGTSLSSLHRKSPTFSRSKRFNYDTQNAKKTGYLVGPGTYNASPLPKIKGGVIYKPFHIKSNPVNLQYIGDSLVKSSNHLKTPDPKKKSANRSTSASEKNFSTLRTQNNRKNSPFLDSILAKFY